MNALTKNWMPALAAIISAIASGMIFMQFGGFIDFPRWVLGILAFIQAGGTAALGVTAKQFNVTGGDVGQPSTLKALADANQAPAVGAAAPKTP
jgi:hypothetical protein